MIWLGCERYTFNKIEDGGTGTLYNTDKLAYYLLLDDKISLALNVFSDQINRPDKYTKL